MQVPDPDLPYGLDLLSVTALYEEGLRTKHPTFWVLASRDHDGCLVVYSMDEAGKLTLDYVLDPDGEPLPADKTEPAE